MPAAARIDLSAIPEDQRDAVAALLRENSDLKGETVSLKEIVQRLEHLVAELNHVVHGKKSEKLSEDDRQLAFEDLETAVAEVEEQKDAQAPADETPRRKTSSPKRNRGNLPESLPRIEQVIEPDSLMCPCGCGPMHKIGEDRTERLDIVPAQLRVIATVRPKYACRACTDGVTQAPTPAALIEGGLPTEGAIAHVLVSKYADHLPLYRQSQILARSGIIIHRSTLADWVGVAAFHLRPVVDRLAEHLKASTKLFMDETTAPILDPGRGRTKTGYLWALARDDRGWGGVDPPGVVFFYAPDRGGQNAEAFLRGFDGTLQLDGYTGYNRLTRATRKGGDPISVAHCWAHARRKLKEVFDRDSVVPEARLRRDDRGRGSAPHRRVLRRGGRHPRHRSRAKALGTAGKNGAPRRCLRRLAAPATSARLGQVAPRRKAGLHPSPLGRAADLPSRWARRDRLQPGGKSRAPDCPEQEKRVVRRA